MTLEEALRPVKHAWSGADYFHPHPVENTIGGSSLTKYTAEELTKRMLADRGFGEKEEAIDGYWSFLGNVVGDGTLREIRSRELVMELPIGDDWIIRIHPDGTRAIDGKVWMYEHKFHTNATMQKREAAFRQATLALAIGEYRRETEGTVVYKPASWAGDDVEPFEWCAEYGYGGVVVAIAQNVPPGILTGREIDEATLAQWLGFYLRKARVIRDAILQKDPSIARQWDTQGEGLTEFAREGDTVLGPAHPLTTQLTEYRALADQIDELDERKKALGKEVLRAMREGGIDEAVVDGHKAIIVSKNNPARADMDAIRKMGLEGILLKPGGRSEYIQVRRMVKD